MGKSLLILKNETPLTSLTPREKIILFNYLRNQIMNFNTYKWGIGNYKSFVKKNNLKYAVCYKALKESASNHPRGNTIGLQLFLQKVEQLNNTSNNFRIIIDKRDRESFLKDLIDFQQKYFKHLKKSELFNLVHMNFDTGLGIESLRNFYYNKVF
ncbi:hypothetical protein [Arenibacter lacus]|uniref:hypothetical protein n=1 Tax=Arenibacter lacus TaxID=2608629 RepID=UPI00123DF6DE|nr:hypothetical protein [Arenibacter lacus]